MRRITAALGAALCTLLLTGMASAGVEIAEVPYAPRITGSHGLLHAQDGSLYICDSYAGTDKVYRIEGGGLVEVASGFSTPAGLWQDDQGRFYVCDVNASRIYRYSDAWVLDRTWVVENPWNVVIAPDGRIYVATYTDAVYEIEGETVAEIWTGLSNPFGIARDGEGSLYVAEHTAGRIAKRTAAGETSVFASGLAQPEGLRWGPDDRLWMADTLEGVLYRFDPDGTPHAVDPGGHDLSLAVNLTQVRGSDIHLGCAGGNGRIYRLTWTEGTPVPTPVTPLPTASPTLVPTATASPPPTATASPSPTSPSPTQSASPTATPIPPLGVDLVLATSSVHPGDTFALDAVLTNPDAPLADVPLAVILDVAGWYWFWPAWTLLDLQTGDGVDWDEVALPTGATEVAVLPPFPWPDTGQDHAEGLWFHGLMLTPDLGAVLGEADSEEWSFGP